MPPVDQLGEGAAYRVARSVVPAAVIDDALRLLHVNLLEEGASAPRLADWLWSAHWFPHLKHRQEILALAEALPDDWTTGSICDPQILLQFPHVGPRPEITFHLDQEPDWADGRRYLRIVGVPLTPWREANGGLLVANDGGPAAVELNPGDAVMMTPELAHSGGVNTTGSIRYGVYLRWLEDGPRASSISAPD